MKNFGKKFLCILFSLCVLTNLAGAAAIDGRSSLYLDGYSATLTAKRGGKIVVTVDISGRGYMEEIGTTKIYIYESRNNTSFKRVETYKCDDYPIMMSSGTVYYEDAATYVGKPGYYYKASVYCYAGDGTNGDERNYTTAAVKALA